MGAAPIAEPVRPVDSSYVRRGEFVTAGLSRVIQRALWGAVLGLAMFAVFGGVFLYVVMGS